jgi:superfamily I DNA/RNA helicase
MRNPTPEQISIFEAVKQSQDNIIIKSYAGCGKTTTLEMLETQVSEKPILYLVFNKRNAVEAEARMASTTTIRTFNSLGHRIWARYIGKNPRLNKNKTADILKAYIDEAPKAQQSELWKNFSLILDSVRWAKSLGYIPEGSYTHAKRLINTQQFLQSLEEIPNEPTAKAIDKVLCRSIAASLEGHINFDDQVYMSALFGGAYPKFPLILVDEAQDLSPINHAMVERLVGDRRIIVVGDPAQSIYLFRGAVSGGMATIESKYSMRALDLSVSFRCPQAIVENARWRVPNFKWVKSGGEVAVLDRLNPSSVGDGAAIICRNNAPLFSVAIGMLASGHGVNVSGIDIGARILNTMRKLGDDAMTCAQAEIALDNWLAERQARGSKIAEDMADCIRVFLRISTSLGTACSYLEHLLKQTGRIQFLTGHKAKGLEFETVYHLNPYLCKDNEQDLNLRYVIQTRSYNRYYEIRSDRIDWKKEVSNTVRNT